MTQILSSPYDHSRELAKAPPEQTGGLQTQLSEQQTLGKAPGQLQASLPTEAPGKETTGQTGRRGLAG